MKSRTAVLAVLMPLLLCTMSIGQAAGAAGPVRFISIATGRTGGIYFIIGAAWPGS